MSKISRRIDGTIGGAALAATLAGALLATPAGADTGSWYAGAALGRVFVDRNVSAFDDGSLISGRVDRHDSGGKLFRRLPGFQSLGPFNRAFESAYGMTPTEYRAANASPPGDGEIGGPGR